ncbi:hypothetical protein [Bordetella genomosp. 9]|uniref:Uncharacterized protein n=1 Tax=Bordetella genomosp. 9 TaxID=1416803 RepID=A0A1W6Z2R2_9BORD|nr:hypothetical protein [Bordetella genomosp. 9]ARP87399.1 hypothetical protein CAL13_15160 [Bordetella genomosp. 9]
MTEDNRKPATDNPTQRGKEPDEKRRDADREYQENLDEAVEETFPASDPISPAVAEKADRHTPPPREDAGSSSSQSDKKPSR